MKILFLILFIAYILSFYSIVLVNKAKLLPKSVMIIIVVIYTICLCFVGFISMIYEISTK